MKFKVSKNVYYAQAICPIFFQFGATAIYIGEGKPILNIELFTPCRWFGFQFLNFSIIKRKASSNGDRPQDTCIVYNKTILYPNYN